MKPTHTVLRELYGSLPPAQQAFVWARHLTAPLEALALRAPEEGRIADLGCGRGLLTGLLAHGHPSREVVGQDSDGGKLSLARRSVGTLPNVRFEQGTVDTLARREPGRFDAVVGADLLFKLPYEEWPRVLDGARRLLRPGGRLLLKEARGDASWKHLKCVAQERLKLWLLRRTEGAGGLTLLAEAEMQRLLEESGFTDVRTTDLSRGYATPHVLYEATLK